MEIDVNELKRLTNTNIIDIRLSYSYDKGAIEGAININEKELMNSPYNYLDKSKKYYIYCKEGLRSKKVCMYLNCLGYDTISIKGGYKEYIKKRS